MPPAKAAPRKTPAPKAPPRPSHVRGGTTLRAGGGSYYSSGGTRTVTGPGGGKASAGRGQVRYQAASGQRITVAAPSRTYHRIILAEFITCVVLVMAVPVLSPRKATAGSDAASLAGPLVRLTAVCILFFVLALMGSGEKAGKAAAAFGGLVTLGALLNATDTVTGLARAFAGSPAAPAAAAATATAASSGAVTETGVIEEG